MSRYKTIIGGAFACLFSVHAACAAHGDIVTAKLENFRPHTIVFAKVAPAAIIPLRAAATGVITGLKVLPGDRVQAGETLATLGGAERDAALAQSTAAVATAQAKYDAAKKLLAILRRSLSNRLSTHQTIDQADSASKAAKAARTAATAQLASLQQTGTITAPVDGIVLSRAFANGTRVTAGETLLKLRPAGGLWLTGAVYGADRSAVKSGMTGTFTPADGGKPLAVTVRSVFAAMNADGGETVTMTPTDKAEKLHDGAYGTLILAGAAQKMIAVPTRALILDHGHWWVLVKTDKGDRRQKVTIGPARGWQTFIKSGLKEGEAVIVDNAYLMFHHGIAQRYQRPD